MAKAKSKLKNPEIEISRLRATGRNDTCACGSNKKYKKCHLHGDEEAERIYLTSIQDEKQKVAGAEAKKKEEDSESAEIDVNKKSAPKVVAKSGGAPRTPKGTVGSSAANAQRSMPRKAQ